MDIEKVRSYECRNQQQYVDYVPLFDDSADHADNDIDDDCRHTGLHPDHQSIHNRIFPEIHVKIGNERDDGKRRRNRPQNCHQSPQQSRHAVADQNGRVDCDCARSGLPQSDQIQHLIRFDPLEFFHELFLHQRHDDIPAAESKRAQNKRRFEQQPKQLG